ncbi:uncharacterized protein LOC119988105 [Tripterygium wilfordii]|uniref:uncharacterized protein LOC119988105 n=1 Tax=Tripterygium wilfordii TaxID=458696 RepID=UPI0018F80481|nr:uncharacterized protein LOC119988105 [Tripterygium wilfordii]
MTKKESKVSRKERSQRFSSHKRSNDYVYEEEEENLKRLKLDLTECRVQAECQENMLRELDHVRSDLIHIREINQMVIQRNMHVLQLLDLLMLVIILDGSVSLS